MTIPNVRNLNQKNNQERGKRFEQWFIRYLSRQGFWVHFMHPAPDGSQPFDILAIQHGIVHAYDCKTLKGKRFPLNRIEDNQKTAFEMLNNQNVYHTYFVIQREENPNCIYIVRSRYLISLQNRGIKSINLEEDNYVICCSIEQDIY